MNNSVLKQIRICLENEGLDVYYPSEHKGDCIEPYVVVKYDGGVDILNVSSERPIYTIMIYVPVYLYGVLDSIMFDIKETLKQMYPTIMYNKGSETPSYYDESVKGHMISFSYLGIRKVNDINLKGV